jgi:hypothetical protein
MHVGSLPDELAGRNTYEEHAGDMWGILNVSVSCVGLILCGSAVGAGGHGFILCGT